MNTEERLFWNLAVVAWSDGEIQQKERELLEEYRVWLQLPGERAEELFELAEGDAVPEKMARPGTKEEQEELFRMIVEMALADGRLDSDERSLLERFFRSLGSDENELSALIERYWREVKPADRAVDWSDEDTIRLLAVAAVVDGHLDGEEHDYLLEMAESVGVGRQKAIELIEDVIAEGRGKIILPANEEEALRVLISVGEMVGADGKVEPKERRLLKKLQKKSGLPDEMFARCLPFEWE